MRARIMEGDMRDRIAELDDESIDAIVTDPPYHLTSGKNGGSGAASVNLYSPAGRARVTTGFMGMKWDGGDLAARPETWAPLLRVAKPGAHLVAFGGSRTFHRVWCAVEDAGWKIRDTILWLHGEGFPKSLNLEFCSLADRRDWTGFGTALKPAFEPIILARKPLIGTVTENLIAHGVGALNIDACRVPTGGRPLRETDAKECADGAIYGAGLGNGSKATGETILGRWPANVLHDGSEEVIAAFPNSDTIRIEEPCPDPELRGPRWGTLQGNRGPRGYDGNGSAARFFWCPKASRSDRNEDLEGFAKKAVNWSSGDQSPGTFQSENTDRENENFHPTVKPTELMRYLVRLVTPRGGLVLDPFMGSGSTGKAALLEAMNFVGIEIDPEYARIARARIRGVAPLLVEMVA